MRAGNRVWLEPMLWLHCFHRLSCLMGLELTIWKQMQGSLWWTELFKRPNSSNHCSLWWSLCFYIWFVLHSVSFVEAVHDIFWVKRLLHQCLWQVVVNLWASLCRTLRKIQIAVCCSTPQGMFRWSHPHLPFHPNGVLPSFQNVRFLIFSQMTGFTMM